MSKRELNRIDILVRLESGRLTPAAAAELLRVSERQVYRLQRRFREDGPAGIADRLAQVAQSHSEPARLGRRRSDRTVCAPPPQAPSHPT